MQQFLPLPEQARPIAEPAEGYRLQRVGDAGYVVISGFVQSSFVVTSGGVVVVDYAAQVEPGNAWAAQTIWFDAVANQVTAELVAKWKDRLVGVDTFTHDTVIAAIISISTDAPKHMP